MIDSVVDKKVRGSVNMVDIHRKVDWIKVSGKWTRMSVIGCTLAEEYLEIGNQGDSDNRVIIFFIPGNPGNDGLYCDFGRRVIRNLLAREERLGVKKLEYFFYTISNLNHILLPHDLNHCSSHRTNARFSLHDQIQHKLDFVREYLPRGYRVYMFGHNIGSYMLLSILPYIKDDFNLKKAVCLFPTIERMSESTNGIHFKKVISTLSTNKWLTKILFCWLDLLPTSAKRRLIRINFTQDNAPPEFVDSFNELLHINVIRNIIHLFNDELDKVGDLEDSMLLHKDLIYFYYGSNDGWCPIEYANEMKNKMSRGHVIIDESGSEHNFAFRNSSKIAEDILQFIV